jgi:DNA (cytosine-5)-methyltransferase 1
MPLSAIDLFAGAGGFSLAAENVGVRVLAAVENNIHASLTYRRNLIEGRSPAPRLYSRDILFLSAPQVLRDLGIVPGECDIILGGPPCQGFSAHRINDAGVEDPRNALLWRYFSFVRSIRPKIFLVENVPGMLWSRHEDYVHRFYRLAERAGYAVQQPVVLNARDYGVPQNRKRVFILGIRLDVGSLIWPPKPSHFDPTSDAVRVDRKPAWLRAEVAFKRIPKLDENAIHMEHGPSLVEAFKNTPLNGGSRRDSGRLLPCHRDHDGHKDVYGRIDPSVPGPTMTTACINPSKGRFVHPTKPHGISLRHAARLQGFPDSFIFEGGLMAGGIQVGNAVPIQLGEAVVRHLTVSLLARQQFLRAA